MEVITVVQFPIQINEFQVLNAEDFPNNELL